MCLTLYRHGPPGGTGQIISAIHNDEIDLGIALTDALIAGIANGNKDYLLVGQYVTTPLNWLVRPLIGLFSLMYICTGLSLLGTTRRTRKFQT